MWSPLHWRWVSKKILGHCHIKMELSRTKNLLYRNIFNTFLRDFNNAESGSVFANRYVSISGVLSEKILSRWLRYWDTTCCVLLTVTCARRTVKYFSLFIKYFPGSSSPENHECCCCLKVVRLQFPWSWSIEWMNNSLWLSSSCIKTVLVHKPTLTRILLIFNHF